MVIWLTFKERHKNADAGINLKCSWNFMGQADKQLCGLGSSFRLRGDVDKLMELVDKW